MFELMVRLNPKPAPLVRLGGRSELTTQDIAAACSGADPVGLKILISRITGDSEISIHTTVLSLVKALSKENKWKCRDRDNRLESLANLVVLEYILEPRCPLCHGTKYYQNKPCDVCKATGFIRWNDQERASAIGVNPSVWLRTWKERYALVMQRLNEHETDAYRSIRDRLR